MRAGALRCLAATVVLFSLAACRSGGGQAAPATSALGSTSTGRSTANPNAPEVSPAGDIPDNQVFVKFVSRDRAYALEVPEGWGRTETAGATTFSDHFNSIRIDVKRSAAAPTTLSARATDVPALRRTVAGFKLGNAVLVRRTAGPVVRLTYTADSAPDAVTGKRVPLAVERYEFWHNGSQVTVTLAAPQGSDNVDAWRRVTDSVAWSA
jgi:hypothetical protein